MQTTRNKPRKPLNVLIALALLASVTGGAWSALGVADDAPSEESSANSSVEAPDVPVTFEENQGQTGSEIRFLARTGGATLALRDAGATWHIENPTEEGSAVAALPMTFVGANPTPTLRSEGELATKSNFYLGSDPSAWIEGVRHHARVVYEDLYPGIDLVFYGNGPQVEYDFVLAPGAEAGAIRLAFPAADSTQVAGDGSLLVRLGSAEVRQAAPQAFQGETAVEAAFQLVAPNTVSFALGAYDGAEPLVIDPILYTSYIGGNAADGGTEVALLPGGGLAYVTGTSASPTFAYGGCAICVNGGGNDAYVMAVNPAGTAVLWWTFLGGSGREFAQGIDVDPLRDVYVTGWTQSPTFPVTAGAFKTTPPGMSPATRDDGYVTKLAGSSGTIVYSTFLGGSSDDEPLDIVVDAKGSAVVSGSTASSNYDVTIGAYDTTYNGGWDAFVTKLDPTGSSLLWSTFVGGSLYDRAQAVNLDFNDDVFVAGWSTSNNYPTLGGGQLTYAGNTDAILTKISFDGSTLMCSSYYGGGGIDQAWDVEAAPNQRAVWFTGESTSANLATWSTFQGGLVGLRDAFVAKFQRDECQRMCSTYLGGVGLDYGRGIGIAENLGSAWVAGYTYSVNFPVTTSAFQPTLGGSYDAFLARIDCVANPVTPIEFAVLGFSSYFGGADGDSGSDVDVEPVGAVWRVAVTGGTRSNPLPATGGAFDTTYNGNTDGYVFVYQ